MIHKALTFAQEFLFLTDGEPKEGLIVPMFEGVMLLFVICAVYFAMFGKNNESIIARVFFFLVGFYYVSNNQLQLVDGLYISLNIFGLPLPILNFFIIQGTLYIFGSYLTYCAFKKINQHYAHR